MRYDKLVLAVVLLKFACRGAREGILAPCWEVLQVPSLASTSLTATETR